MARKTKTNAPAASGSHEDALSARERILRSAEKIFGNSGFDGGSMRRIADDAGVPVALVSYHFDTKLALYHAVFMRRVPIIVEKRLAGLNIALGVTDTEQRVELIVRALILPMMQLRAQDKSPDFGRLMARETTDPNAEERGFVRELFDPIAYKMIEALSIALPNHSRQEIAWAYQFMLGAMIYVMSDNGRIERISSGACRPEDEASVTDHMVRFLTAGILNFSKSVTPADTSAHAAKNAKTR
jgi:AcrR family transcriptional regulator